MISMMEYNIETCSTEGAEDAERQKSLRFLRLVLLGGLIALSYIIIAEYNIIRISTALRGMLR